MNRLNIFNYYRNLEANHENILTRNFLILIKNIPLVETMFFTMVEKEMSNFIDLPSFAIGDLSTEEINTQKVGDSKQVKNILDGRRLISIIISDDKLEDEVKIQSSDRGAVYDGLILADPSLVFIIENKPSKDNIWLEQLKPNAEGIDLEIIKEPCCLSWRDLIDGLNKLLQRNSIYGLEKQMLEDFIEYIGENYPWLNPYTNFGLCKEDLYLLNRRCQAIMAEIEFKGQKNQVHYHRGWKHYIESGENTIRKIALDANETDKELTIDLWLYVGDTMSAAREFYEMMDIERFLALRDKGFQLNKNFHISAISTNLLYLDGSVTLEEYIYYWKEEYPTLKQVQRGENESGFKKHFKMLEDNKIIDSSAHRQIEKKIYHTKRSSLNICPGLGIKYSWKLEDAINLDENNKFKKDFEEKLQMVFDSIKKV